MRILQAGGTHEKTAGAPPRARDPGSQAEADMKFRLALAQMLVVGGEPERNLARAEAMVAEAAAQGADVVLLPETMDLGWTHPSARLLAEAIPSGRPCARLRATARRHGVYICAGLTERDGEAVYNAAVIINRDGAVCALHRKINELEIGHACYDQGDRLGVAHTELGTLGLMICADALADRETIPRTLCAMGADVILSPCSWAVPADHDPIREPYGELWRLAYRPVARAHSVWIAGVSNVGVMTGGPWDGHLCIGSSLLIDGDGREVVTGTYGAGAEALLYADVATRDRSGRGAVGPRISDDLRGGAGVRSRRVIP